MTEEVNENDINYCIEENVYDDDGKLVGIKRTYPNRKVTEGKPNEGEPE